MSTRRGDDWQCDHGAPFFEARDAGFLDEVAKWAMAGAVAPWNARVVSVSPGEAPVLVPSATRYVGVPGMTMPARLLSNGVTVSIATTIKALVREASGWRLLSAEAGAIDDVFDVVIVSVPAPQAVPLLDGAAPDLAVVAARAQMCPVWAVMAQCETDPSLGFDAAIVRSGPLRWIGDDATKPGRSGRGSWALHASSAWSESHLELPAEAVVDSLISAFRELGGPRVIAATAHRWRYAEPSSAAAPPVQGYLWDSHVGIGACGDWLGGNGVEGAWLSGSRLATAIGQSRSGHPRAVRREMNAVPTGPHQGS